MLKDDNNKNGHEALNPIHPSVPLPLDLILVDLYNEHVANTPSGPTDLKLLRRDYSQLSVLAHDGDRLDIRIDFHGGGWSLGDLNTESHILAHYTGSVKVCVVCVAYRLRGRKHCPCSRPLGTRRLISIKLVAVGTPVIDDLRKSNSAADAPWDRMRLFERAPILNCARLKWFDGLKWSSVRLFLPHGRPNSKGLCRQVIATADCNPLRDEGEALTSKCVEGAAEVVLRRFDGLPHPFMHMDEVLWQERDFIALMERKIGRALQEG
ncbi:hypothetical protein K490DRAFT_74410 [Saccharata proteae CBS 121410]|uniref:Alpha/beta hydrolase fold-3 domain-containing protein n=1 Tax=Saccharata proteae CBS 121410 TaxID=1314787 RepID=A0A9P4HV19_9PEZI|nr:hypothetical protein K490DRAFT_74410 [Saccharata proteae CBS 121410]